MPKKLSELYTSKDVIAYWVEKNLNTYSVGEQLFPQKKQLGIKLDWVKGAQNQPIGLRLSSFDAKSIRRDREGLDSYTTKMPFFKESIVLDEETRQELNMVIQSGNQEIIDAVLSNIFDDQVKLITAAQETLERMRMQVLTTGTVVLSSNGQSYTYDYGMPSGNKRNASTAWTSPSANPVKDINDAKKLARQAGYKITRAMCNSNALEALTANSALSKKIYALAGGTVEITSEEVRRYLERELKIAIYVNDEGYIDEANGNFVNYIADDLFVLMPDGELGKTNFGTTPEESDLMTGTDADTSILDNSIAVTTFKIPDPVNIETKVDMVALPSFTKADGVFIIDIA